MKCTLSDIRDAFDYVSVGDYDCNAVICRATGAVYLITEPGALDEDPPEDWEDETKYLPVPNKYDLDLGGDLVFRFALEKAPDIHEDVRGIFSRSGAYRRYKDYLHERDLLDAWRAFEEAETVKALREWCEENGVEVVEE